MSWTSPYIFLCFFFLSPTVWRQVMHSVLDVEHPLVQGQLRDIDAQLKKAEESLNWNSQGQDTN